MTKAVHVAIEGRVQGVGYRDWTVRTAMALGLGGWVRNRRDGTVEAVFSGEEGRVEEMLARCRQGPRAADVTAVRLLPDALEVSEGFEVRGTA